MLTIKTLGTFDVLIDGISLTEGVEARRGLLVLYLAEKGNAVERARAAALLWPGVEGPLALNSLRVLLSRMRRQSSTPFVEAGRTTITLNDTVAVDYDADFIRQIGQRASTATLDELRQAADRYHGTFLGTVSLDPFPALDEWAVAVRAEIEMMMVRILDRLLTRLLGEGSDPAAAVTYAEHLLELVPDDDISMALYLQALAANRQLAKALQQFAAYRRHVSEYRAVGSELTALMAQLSRPDYAARLVEPQAPSLTSNGSTPPPKTVETSAGWIEGAAENNEKKFFPHIEHPIIGRAAETTQLMTLLDNGNRMISIVGIGGTGKTFFVRSQFDRLRGRFGNAIYFVDLRNAGDKTHATPQQATDALLSGIATALKLKTAPNQPLFEQVAAALTVSKACLVLDNFESVQPAASTVMDLLLRLPQLTTIITTRRRLHFTIEATIFMAGLSRNRGERADVDWLGIGADSSGADLTVAEISDAVRYFIYCAGRQNLTLTINKEAYPWIEQICAEVEGLPLAIELTAMQITFYNLDELAKRISVDRSLLHGEVGDLPGDHYSVWAVLDSMWTTLDDDEQRVLAQLSVFAGVFHREALEAVAPAPRRIYQGLMNASLLRIDEPAWFSLHPLVRQYAAERLNAAFDVEATAQQHARHYLESLDLGDQPMEMRAITEPVVWSRLQRNVADIHLAWRWAVSKADWASLAQAVTSFAHLHRLLGQHQRGYAFLDELMQALPPEAQWSPLQTQLAGRAALFLNNLGIRDGDPAMAKPWIDRAITWLDAAGTAHDQVAARYLASWSALSSPEVWGNVPTLLAQGLAIAQQNDLPSFIGQIQMYYAVIVYLPMGQWRAAVDAVRQAVTTYGDLSTVINHEVTPISNAVNGVSLLLCCLEMDEAERLLAATEPALDQPQQPFVGGFRAVRSLFQCTFLAHRGEVDAAIADMQSTLRIYTEEYKGQASLAYGFLALCLARRGDFSEAIATARQGLAHIEALGGGYLLGYAQQRLAEVLLMAEDFVPVAHKDEVLALLDKALAGGQEFKDVQVIFPALYALVHARRAEIPPALFERVIKIGACSPALYYEMHPIGRERLAAEGIVLTDEEAETLYDTDREQVKALMAEVLGYIG